MIPKTLTTFASITALSLALGHSAVAEESPDKPAAAPPPQAQAAASEAGGSAGAEPSAGATSEAEEPEAAAAEAVPATSEAPAEEAAAPAAPGVEPPATSEPPPVPPGVAAKRAEMEQRFEERMAERRLRYDELRVRAKEAGIDLPETPPWERQPMAAPGSDWMSREDRLGLGPRPRMSQEEIQAMREERYHKMRERAKARGLELPEVPPWTFMTEEEREAHLQKMRSMTPEERMAYREENWQKIRERAKAQGVDMPEESPWKQRMERRQTLQDKWKEYNQIVQDMTPEEREAAQAIFGSEPPRGRLPVSPRWGKRVQPPMVPPPEASGYGPGQAYAPRGYGAPAFGKGPASGRGFGPGVQPYGGYGPGAGPYGGQFGAEPAPGGYGPTPTPYGGDYGPGPGYGDRPYAAPGYGPNTGYGPGSGPGMSGPGGGWGKQPSGGGRNPY